MTHQENTVEAFREAVAVGAAIAIFLTLAHVSHTLGQLILPSEPKTNRFGPNPNEASS